MINKMRTVLKLFNTAIILLIFIIIAESIWILKLLGTAMTSQIF